jgi:hypothetical protein
MLAHTRPLHGTGRTVIALIALLVLVAAGPSFAQGPAPAAEPAGASTVYLPLLRGGAQPQPPQPPPSAPAPPARAGFFALDDWLTYSAGTAVDAAGGVHLTMFLSDERHQDQPLNQPALYSYCPGPAASCADPARWSDPVLFGERVNEVQVAVSRDGKPRLLVRRSGSRFNEYDYYACDADCTRPAGWSGLTVAEDAGGDLNGFALGNHYFALDGQDRPRFAYGNGWGNGQPNGIYYASCDAADCTQPGSWQRTRAFVGPDNVTTSGEAASLVFDGARPHMVINRYVSGLPAGLLYLTCEAGCDETAGWRSAEIAPPGNRAWASWDLALDAAGRPRLALFEPAGIDIAVGGALYYLACDEADCARPDAWRRTLAASGEGRNADLSVDAQGRAHMVYDAGQRGVVGELWCDADCDNAASWRRRILETNEALMAELTPASPLSCSQQEVAWLDALPSATVAPTGELVVAYDAKYVARCFFVDPADPQKRVYTEVKRVWWAVRWAQFARG